MSTQYDLYIHINIQYTVYIYIIDNNIPITIESSLYDIRTIRTVSLVSCRCHTFKVIKVAVMSYTRVFECA